MPPSPAAPCGRCQRLSSRAALRNLPPLFAPSQTVLPSTHLARTLTKRSRAVSLRARLPSRGPQTAARTCNQQVDEQALSSLKELEFQSADESRAGKRPQISVGRPLLWVPRRPADQCGGFAGATAAAMDFS